MKMKYWISVLAVAVLMMVFTGCGKDSEESASADKPFIVGFANNSDMYDYCAKFRSYLKEETEAKGIEIMVTDANGDTSAQNDQIEVFLIQEAKVVSAISNDLDGSVPALEAAKKADVPYISFLTTVRGADDYAKFIYIGSQNYDAGGVQGDYLVRVLPENAKVLYFTGQPNDQQYIDRKTGFMDKLAARSDIEILAEYNVENARDLGMSTAEDCLQAFSEFDAIVCQNDDSALGVVEALKAANRLDGVEVVGLDGSDGALKSIKAGEMTMSVLQDARAQAKAGAEVFAKIRDGVDPAAIEDIFVPFAEITSENIDSFF